MRSPTMSYEGNGIIVVEAEQGDREYGFLFEKLHENEDGNLVVECTAKGEILPDQKRHEWVNEEPYPEVPRSVLAHLWEENGIIVKGQTPEDENLK